MSYRTMKGQLNLFDFFREPEAGSAEPVEMISLMPPDEPEEATAGETPEEECETPEPEGKSEIKKSKPEAEESAENTEEAEALLENEEQTKDTAEANPDVENVLQEPEAEESAEDTEEAEALPENEEQTKDTAEANPEAETVPPEPKAEEQTGDVVMQQCYENGGKLAQFAYLNYNKVYEKLPDHPAAIYCFSDSKEAVAYYITQIRSFAELAGWRQLQDFSPPAFGNVKMIMKNT